MDIRFFIRLLCNWPSAMIFLNTFYNWFGKPPVPLFFRFFYPLFRPFFELHYLTWELWHFLVRLKGHPSGLQPCCFLEKICKFHFALCKFYIFIYYSTSMEFFMKYLWISVWNTKKIDNSHEWGNPSPSLLSLKFWNLHLLSYFNEILYETS